MGEITYPLILLNCLFSRNIIISLITKLRYRLGNRVVQTAIQRPEFIHLKWRIPLECQIGDRLANIAIVVYDFIDGISKQQQIFAMQSGCNTYLRRRDFSVGWSGYFPAFHGFVSLFNFECPDQLTQEQRNAIFKLLITGRAIWTARHFLPATLRKFNFVVFQKFIHHKNTFEVIFSMSFDIVPPSSHGWDDGGAIA
ncbi:MAG TPA: hypothetical protein DCW29_22680 [Janthinobacterium sp.]|nr:hypothetical protein [Janthinobacterium sp.]